MGAAADSACKPGGVGQYVRMWHPKGLAWPTAARCATFCCALTACDAPADQACEDEAAEGGPKADSIDGEPDDAASVRPPLVRFVDNSRFEVGVESSPRPLPTVLQADRATIDSALASFVDDIALSGPSEKVRRAVPSVIREINRQGLRLNYRKSEVQTNGGRQRVTNLNVNRKLGLPRVGGSGKRVLSSKDLRDAVRRAERYGLRKKEEESLRGRLRYLRQLDPRRGQILLARLDAATRDASKTNDERAV